MSISNRKKNLVCQIFMSNELEPATFVWFDDSLLQNLKARIFTEKGRMALRLLGSWLWPLSPLLRRAYWASSPSSRRCSHQRQCIKCLTLCLLSLLSDHWAILCLHKSFLRALKWFPVTSRKCPNFYSGCTGTSGFFYGKGQCQIAVLLPLGLEQLMASLVSFSDKSSIFSFF